jgi:adenylylsulfate kinase
MKEKRIRSLAKAASFRLIATLVNTLIIYILIENVTVSLAIAIADVVVKLGIYFLHERLWACMTWGYSDDRREETAES